MEPRDPLLKDLEPAKPRRPLTARPIVILLLCALCIYGGLLGITALDKIGCLVASGVSLFAACCLLQHFLRLKGRSFP